MKLRIEELPREHLKQLFHLLDTKKGTQHTGKSKISTHYNFFATKLQGKYI